MTHKEMLEALLAGKKLRSKDWNSEYYIHLINDDIVSERGWVCNIQTLDDTMKIVEGPKYQVLYKDPGGIYETTPNRYESEEDFKTYRISVGTQFIKLLKGE